MWCCLSDAFLSIVEPEPGSPVLRVRARRKGDIERVFPGAKVERTPGRDYLYRAHIDREIVAQVMADQVRGISYGNFKNSVRNSKLHDAYAGFWSIMARLQEIPPYSTSRRQKGLF
ncbi:MAG: hypothetical protein ABFE07_00335 [Armatimonadia bacterium]